MYLNFFHKFLKPLNRRMGRQGSLYAAVSA